MTLKRLEWLLLVLALVMGGVLAVVIMSGCVSSASNPAADAMLLNALAPTRLNRTPASPKLKIEESHASESGPVLARPR